MATFVVIVTHFVAMVIQATSRQYMLVSCAFFSPKTSNKDFIKCCYFIFIAFILYFILSKCSWNIYIIRNKWKVDMNLKPLNSDG